MLALRGPVRQAQELRPRWCVVKFLDENVVHVNNDKTHHWITACGRDIAEGEYSRQHPQLVNCLACLVAMGADGLYLT
jgi:hypothetical protein